MTRGQGRRRHAVRLAVSAAGLLVLGIGLPRTGCSQQPAPNWNEVVRRLVPFLPRPFGTWTSYVIETRTAGGFGGVWARGVYYAADPGRGQGPVEVTLTILAASPMADARRVAIEKGISTGEFKPFLINSVRCVESRLTLPSKEQWMLTCFPSDAVLLTVSGAVPTSQALDEFVQRIDLAGVQAAFPR